MSLYVCNQDFESSDQHPQQVIYNAVTKQVIQCDMYFRKKIIFFDHAGYQVKTFFTTNSIEIVDYVYQILKHD